MIHNRLPAVPFPSPRRVAHLSLLGAVSCPAVLGAFLAFGDPVARAQDTAAAQRPPAARLESPFRRLAPGVETTIPADVDPEEIVMEHPMTSLLVNADLKWDPNYWPQSRTLHGMAESAEFYRDAWGLQFTFKPLRMIDVDIPQPSGRMQRKRIWYMVYRVTNTGARLEPVEVDDGVIRAEPAEGQPVKFYPHFVLESHDRDRNGDRIYKAYLDRILPTAVAAIQQREDPNRELLTTMEMAGREIPVSSGDVPQSVWGVVTWEDVDPQIDFFSVYVAGLSNAYKWRDQADGVAAEDPPLTGRQFYRKTLQLNFWRPGDDIEPHEGEIRYGTPPDKADLYDTEEGLAYRWVYR